MLYQTKNVHGGDIYAGNIRYDFSANTNPFGTPPGVLDAMRAALSQVHHYPDPYCRELTAAISAHEQLPPQWVLCGNGAADLIYAYCAALQPKKALELAPTFSEYSLALSQIGCRVYRHTLTKDRLFTPDASILGRIRLIEPDVLFLCNPNNPTGRLIDPELLNRIAAVCREKHIRIFLDECFLDLTPGGISMKDRLEEYPELFILKAFTKSYGMAGVRLGYCLCADRALLARMSQAVQPWNVSTLAQCAGVAALKEQVFLDKTNTLISRERGYLQQNLENLGFWVCPSRTNFLLFQGPEGLCKPLGDMGIALRNCDNYPGLSAGWYRCAVRLRPENEALIDALRHLV